MYVPVSCGLPVHTFERSRDVARWRDQANWTQFPRKKIAPKVRTGFQGCASASKKFAEKMDMRSVSVRDCLHRTSAQTGFGGNGLPPPSLQVLAAIEKARLDDFTQSVCMAGSPPEQWVVEGQKTRGRSGKEEQPLLLLLASLLACLSSCLVQSSCAEFLCVPLAPRCERIQRAYFAEGQMALPMCGQILWGLLGEARSARAGCGRGRDGVRTLCAAKPCPGWKHPWKGTAEARRAVWQPRGSVLLSGCAPVYGGFVP